MHGYIVYRSFLRDIIFLTTLLLVVAFILHTVEFDHPHPAFFGHGVRAALHEDDKKRLMLAILTALLTFAAIGSIWLNRFVPEMSALFVTRRKRYPDIFLFDSLRKALRKGIVHPKLCG